MISRDRAVFMAGDICFNMPTCGAICFVLIMIGLGGCKKDAPAEKQPQRGAATQAEPLTGAATKDMVAVERGAVTRGTDVAEQAQAVVPAEAAVPPKVRQGQASGETAAVQGGRAAVAGKTEAALAASGMLADKPKWAALKGRGGEVPARLVPGKALALQDCRRIEGLHTAKLLVEALSAGEGQGEPEVLAWPYFRQLGPGYRRSAQPSEVQVPWTDEVALTLRAAPRDEVTDEDNAQTVVWQAKLELSGLGGKEPQAVQSLPLWFLENGKLAEGYDLPGDYPQVIAYEALVHEGYHLLVMPVTYNWYSASGGWETHLKLLAMPADAPPKVTSVGEAALFEQYHHGGSGCEDPISSAVFLGKGEDGKIPIRLVTWHYEEGEGCHGATVSFVPRSIVKQHNEYGEYDEPVLEPPLCFDRQISLDPDGWPMALDMVNCIKLDQRRAIMDMSAPEPAALSEDGCPNCARPDTYKSVAILAQLVGDSYHEEGEEKGGDGKEDEAELVGGKGDEGKGDGGKEDGVGCRGCSQKEQRHRASARGLFVAILYDVERSSGKALPETCLLLDDYALWPQKEAQPRPCPSCLEGNR